MKRLGLIIGLFLFVFVMFGGIYVLWSIDFDWELKTSDKANAVAKKLQTEIKVELEEIGNHPWAGKYYYGDGLGVNVSLWLAPKNGFLFEWHGCLGLYDRNYGPVTEKNGHICLSCTYKNKREGFQGIAEEFIPVSWGERLYLIPPDKMIEFCNDVNLGKEPSKRSHSHLLRVNDKEKSVIGPPNIPEEFKVYLLKEPVKAEIIFVGSPQKNSGDKCVESISTTIRINAGRKQKLLKGMELSVTYPQNVVESAIIMTTDEDSSEAVIDQFGENPPTPKIGWKLSTKCPWFE